MRPLGILDQSPIAEGSSGADALRNTIDLARLGESLGYESASTPSGSACFTLESSAVMSLMSGGYSSLTRTLIPACLSAGSRNPLISLSHLE